MNEEEQLLPITFENVEKVISQLLKDLYTKRSDIVSFISKQNTFVSFVQNYSFFPSSITLLSIQFPQINEGALSTIVYSLYGIVDANDFDIDENIIMNPDQRAHFREVAAEAMHQQARALIAANPVQQVVIHGENEEEVVKISEMTQKVESLQLQDLPKQDISP